MVVVNPGCVIGPDDHTGSEFGTLCKRFWKGRIPFYFAGGNNFVDVRDVADGIRSAADRGRPGERYLLTGTNQTLGQFFTAMTRAAGRTIPRLGLPGWLGLGFAEVGRWFGTTSSTCRRCFKSGPKNASRCSLSVAFPSRNVLSENVVSSTPRDSP